MSTVPGDDAFRDAGLAASSPGGNGPFAPDESSAPRPAHDAGDEDEVSGDGAGPAATGEGESGLDASPFGGEDAPTQP
ncbi:hypothetical protein [Cellulomonas marina]|uniref:Uncharacterized protein n=1 Tax=Cellulomonas marina TaxID=988821 RepID=A0A1I0ZKR7_9CELL|nr:hypothetical protein [Cellulomonas marina]GIG28637.1 hypothetical protein Cma02nite_12370 [Cellulomonas marina]SFB25706.1 hypothetical protein SAMN05421867_111126 [Cellulomonas marina]